MDGLHECSNQQMLAVQTGSIDIVVCCIAGDVFRSNVCGPCNHAVTGHCSGHSVVQGQRPWSLCDTASHISSKFHARYLAQSDSASVVFGLCQLPAGSPFLIQGKSCGLEAAHKSVTARHHLHRLRPAGSMCARCRPSPAPCAPARSQSRAAPPPSPPLAPPAGGKVVHSEAIIHQRHVDAVLRSAPDTLPRSILCCNHIWPLTALLRASRRHIYGGQPPEAQASSPCRCQAEWAADDAPGSGRARRPCGRQWCRRWPARPPPCTAPRSAPAPPPPPCPPACICMICERRAGFWWVADIARLVGLSSHLRTCPPA